MQAMTAQDEAEAPRRAARPCLPLPALAQACDPDGVARHCFGRRLLQTNMIEVMHLRSIDDDQYDHQDSFAMSERSANCPTVAV